MPTLLKPDICVIGAGSGGLSVAAAAAAFGVPVVLVERGAMGGDCLNYGCVPSKALIAAGRHAEAIRNASRFGIADAKPEVDFAAVHDHARSVIASIAPNDSVARFTALGVKVIQAEGRFRDRRTLLAGDFEIRPRRFVIATGSSPLVPDLPGLDTIPYLTNETIFDLKRRPSHLVIVGAGPVGCELAQAHRRLGTRVTIIDSGRALGREDPELAAVALRRLRAEGVDIREKSKILAVERRGRSGVSVFVDGPGGAESIDGSHLLLAVGRRPNVDSLDLGKAGIRFGPRGIVVSAELRTSNRRAYAIGDVAGGLQFTHVAGYHAGLVLRALLFRLTAREDRRAIPRVTYTDPEVAQVGLTEAEALAKHRGVRILRWSYAENDRAQADLSTEGLIKVIAGRRGRILGVGIAGAGAGEMISLHALALAKGMSVRDLAGFVAPYPTLAEIGKRASMSYFADATRKPLVRWIVRLLRRFG